MIQSNEGLANIYYSSSTMYRTRKLKKKLRSSHLTNTQLQLLKTKTPEQQRIHRGFDSES